MTAPLYEITVDSGDATVGTGEDLIAAWSHTVPDLAAQALDVSVCATAKIYEYPEVVARRTR